MPRGIYPRRVKRHAVTQPPDPSYKIIALTKQQNTLVDADDYEWLNRWNWYAHWDSRMGSFYAARTINDYSIPNHPRWIQFRMHRAILNCSSDEHCDHKNHNTLDNRKKNLRKCSVAQNMHNRKIQSSNKSGFKGVAWNKTSRKWRAVITINGHKKHLGYFDSLEDAARAYDEAAKVYYGEFAVLNFPPTLSCN